MKTGITPTPLPPEVMAEKENAKDLTSGCKRIRIKAQPTHATFQHNILQHCCAQRTAYSWPPCNNMLQQVGWYWIKFENGQIFLQHFWMLQDDARVWPAPSQLLTTRSNSVVRCCFEMLCAFAGPFNTKKLAHTTTLKYTSLHLS